MKRGPRDAQIDLPGWGSGCPVCGHHDKVRLLEAVYQDRQRRRRVEQTPLVNRYGLMVRGHVGIAPWPRTALGIDPPRRPSVFATVMRTGGAQVAGLIGIPFGIAMFLRQDTATQFLASLLVALLLGAASGPLGERARHAVARRTAEWEQAMRTWHTLRYCTRCDQVFVERRRSR